MAVFDRSSNKQAEKLQARREKRFRKAIKAWHKSPAGRARQAYEAGDRVFQYSLDVLNQGASVSAMTGASTSGRVQDPSAVLNSVAAEGWDLVNGDFVFIMSEQTSRDKLVKSGQQVSIAGRVMGYYLFRRDPEAREAESEKDVHQRLWEQVLDEELAG